MTRADGIVTKKFITAFAVAMAALLLVNASTYVVCSRSDGERTSRRVGFPLVFWRNYSLRTSFSPFSLSADVVVALWISYRIGRWWEERGTFDYVTGTKT